MSKPQQSPGPSGTEEAVVLQKFFFPEQCVTIEALSLAEATEKFEKQFKK